MTESTFVPPFEPPVDVRKVALALIVLVGVIGLGLQALKPVRFFK